MNASDVSVFRLWFRDFVKSFYLDDDYVRTNITLKEEHTYRVCENVKTLGKALGLTDNDLRIGETAALLHDLGRFEQFRMYRSFDDRGSENHAALSVKILKRTGMLNRLPQREQDLMYDAIFYHNAYQLPIDLSPDSLLFTRLLRDADKLDILFIVTSYFKQDTSKTNPALELELPDSKDYSSYLINDILRCNCANGSDIKTYNDMKLLQISWIFDINFSHTLRYIYQHDYINKIIDTLPDVDDIRKIRTHVETYIKRKIRS